MQESGIETESTENNIQEHMEINQISAVLGILGLLR